jgi:hypothetical protein
MSPERVNLRAPEIFVSAGVWLETPGGDSRAIETDPASNCPRF